MDRVLHKLRLGLRGRVPLVVKESYLKLRELNATSRAVPDFLIVGAMKAGTTSLFNYLCQHPRIIGSVPKEIFYLCSHPERGERWYRRHFPRRAALTQSHALCGEATPTSLYSGQAARIASELMPNAKIIVLLREPAARAVSHYYHRYRAGRETRAVDEVFTTSMIERLAADAPEGDTEKAICDRGQYVRGLKHWKARFGESQILVLDADIFFQQTQAVYNQVCEFLNIPALTLATSESFNANTGLKQKPEHFRELQRCFDPQNRELAEMGYHFSWMGEG